MRYLRWIITLPITILVLVFAIANRHSAPVDLWPLPFVKEIPLFMLVLVSLLVGIMVGGAVSWISGGVTRKKTRQTLFQLERCERDLEQVRGKLAKAEAQSRENAGNESGKPSKLPVVLGSRG